LSPRESFTPFKLWSLVSPSSSSVASSTKDFGHHSSTMNHNQQHPLEKSEY
jgi:hypothetical protein